MIYFLPVATVSLLGLRRLRKGTTLPHASRALSLASIPWLASLALIVVAELLMAPGLMVLATLAFVALTVIMVAGTASLWLVGLKLER